MKWKEAQQLRMEVKMMHHRLCVEIGNWEDEVVLYVQYQAGSKKIYDELPEFYKNIRIVKDGLKKKTPI